MVQDGREMTLLEKHETVLEDLLEEYDETPAGDWWRLTLERKIAEMKEAIKKLQ